MNRLVLATAIVAGLLAALPASAQTYNESFAATIIENPAVTRSKGRLATTPSAIAPGLTAAGVHSCAGSTTAAGSGTGFGFSFGTTYEMQECNRRAYAATLMGMGQNAAALALVCNNAEVQNALNLTGVRCPQQPAPAAAAYTAARGATVAPVSGGGFVTTQAVAADVPPFCRDRRTYSAQLCLGAPTPR